ncbi:MAG: sulfatase [Candidatus Aminicenantes bacterium]|nr:MAG: sulfatase [Candidatus Aminicenantes bacterium]
MKIIPKFALILLILPAFFCSKSQKEIPHHIFLLEKMASAKIIKTPDLKNLKLKKEQKRTLRSRNSDITLPPSPLIKKIKCLEQTRNVLFAPADSIVDFPLKIKKGAVLEFGFAIDDIYLDRERFPVEFKVLIKKKTGKMFHLLFNEIVFPGNLAFLGWHDKTLPLKNYQGDIILRFETKKHINNTSLKDDLFAYWSNPLVIHPVDKKRKKPKLILISLDTLRADHLEIYDYKRKTAPEMVRYLKDFVVFKNCWSQWCWTLESHQSIMTGLYEVEHNVPEFYPSTPEHLVTLAEIMKSKGYMTAAFTGGSKVAAYTGLCKGFDTYFDNEQGKKGGIELPGTWLRTKQWLKQNARNDFFLFFHTYEIHSPYKTNIPLYDDMFQTNKGDNQYIFDVKQELIGAGWDKVNWYRRKKQEKITKADQDVIRGYQDYYDGSIRYTNDYFLKELIEYLKSLEIYDDTIIVILSDHGEEFFEHGRFYHFDGLYEEYIHVPLMFKFTHSQYGGTVFAGNVETIDVFPTLLEALGIPLKHTISGKSLLGLIKRGSKKPLKMGRKYVFSQSSAKFAVKRDTIKLLLRGRVDHKLNGEIPRIEIYDLSKDPNEQQPIKIDDLSNHKDLYEAVYKKLVMKKRGIHIVFSDRLKGKNLKGEIDIPAGHPEIETFYEVGVTKEDFTRYGKRKEKIIFNWKMSGWNKSLILTSRKDQLKIRFKLKIDGKDYRDFIIDESLGRDGEYIKLSKRSYKSAPKEREVEVFLFGNGVVKRANPRKYFPGINKKNLEKLKALGYIN